DDEVRPAQAVGKKADDRAGRGREGGADREPVPRRDVPAHAAERGGVRSQAEESGMAERDLPRVAAGDVPCARRASPHEDETQGVEEERVANHKGREPGDDEEGERRRKGPHTPSDSEPRWPRSPAGRATRMAMNRTR